MQAKYTFRRAEQGFAHLSCDHGWNMFMFGNRVNFTTIQVAKIKYVLG